VSTVVKIDPYVSFGVASRSGMRGCQIWPVLWVTVS
jgi:hypothetical protein